MLLKRVITDLDKIAVLPDRLEGETAGVQVAWALISKTLPPRVVDLLRAHPVHQTQEMCQNLQDALLNTVRQLIGQPGFTADQLQLAKLPVLDFPTCCPSPDCTHGMHCDPAPGSAHGLIPT